MSHDRLQGAVPDGEALRYTDRLRRGGRVGLTDERILVVRSDDEPTSVELRGIDEVEVTDFDWYLAVLSVVLVGFGVVSLGRNPWLGAGFALVGGFSLYWTYRKRDRALVRVDARARPLVLYPSEPGAFHDALRERLDRLQDRIDEAAGDGRERTPDDAAAAEEPESGG